MNKILLAATCLLFAVACKQADQKASQPTAATADSRYQPKPYVEVKHPDWTRKATIYQVNVRQYTPEGTFKAFETHLPRLKELGVDILWLMPIHPIGVKNRKGTMGSGYSVKDYFAVNPDLGTMDEFKALVQKVHSMGMYLIIDWVANHSAWDNPLATEHPDWYTKTREGNFQPTPWYDWDDIIDFDFNQPALRKYMTEAMKFWVKEADIDGYRCDTGGFIPVDFWDNARAEMDAIKPVFMLAEWESRDMHQHAFDATYAWSLWDHLHAATVGKRGIGALVGYLAHDVNTHPRDGYRMTFTENHDKNSWEGTQFTNFGAALPACIVFTGVVNGMLLCYSGQEAGNDKSLKFFEKDEIKWQPHSNNDLFKTLFALKHENQALWNGDAGGEMVRINNDKMNEVISFSREKNGDKVLAIFNFSDKPTTVKLDSKFETGNYRDLFSGNETALKGDDVFSLKPWGYVILTQKGK